jgi:hypothetical protein
VSNENEYYSILKDPGRFWKKSTEYVARMWEEKKTKFLFENVQGGRPIGENRRRWDDNIRIELGKL